jgi:hypothetical protein
MDSMMEFPRHRDNRDDERRGPLNLGVILSVVVLACLLAGGVWGSMALWSLLQHTK